MRQKVGNDPTRDECQVDSLGAMACGQVDTLVAWYGADERLTVGCERPHAREVLGNGRVYDVWQHLDCALDQLFQRCVCRSNVEPLSEIALLVIEVPACRAPNTEESIQATDHVTALRRTEQHGQWRSVELEQQPFTLQRLDGDIEVQPGGARGCPRTHSQNNGPSRDRAAAMAHARDPRTVAHQSVCLTQHDVRAAPFGRGR